MTRYWTNWHRVDGGRNSSLACSTEQGSSSQRNEKFSNPAFLVPNLLPYDDVRDAVRAIFPEASWMRERYGFSSGLMLPAYHARRLANLAFRRTL